MSRWNSHPRKKKPTAQEQRAQQRAAQLEQCKRGEHRLTDTMRPGERLCLACGLVLYCPDCLQAANLAPLTNGRVFPLECSQHRKAEVQA
jgi:hypothetical protein